MLPRVSHRVNGITGIGVYNRSIQLKRTLDGRFQHDSVVAGDIATAPASVGPQLLRDARHSFLMLGLEPTFFATIDESALSTQVELVPHFCKQRRSALLVIHEWVLIGILEAEILNCSQKELRQSQTTTRSSIRQFVMERHCP